MNYEDMSDHAVNMAVTSIIFECKGWEVSSSNMGFYHCGIDGNGWEEVEVVDYCNKPSDAWPIIIENKIAVMPDSDGTWKSGCLPPNAEKTIGWDKFSRGHENPLRAAIICFLKMKDTEK